MLSMRRLDAASGSVTPEGHETRSGFAPRYGVRPRPTRLVVLWPVTPPSGHSYEEDIGTAECTRFVMESLAHRAPVGWFTVVRRNRWARMRNGGARHPQVGQGAR
jgi:hypothetical protein